MLLVLRFVSIVLMLILINLVLPDLRLGGRYLILMEAFLITLLTQLFRKLIGFRVSYRERSIITGLCSVVVMFLIKMLFFSVNLTIMGILLLYFGLVLLEMVLPDHITSGIWRNE